VGVRWPPRWQQEAIDAVLPYLGSDHRLGILVDDPRVALHGSRVEGYVYEDNEVPTIIHDRSGRPDVFPGELLAGPVLRVELLTPGRPPVELFAMPGWEPRSKPTRLNLVKGYVMGRIAYLARRFLSSPAAR
jgi:hypothetical protein